MKDATRNMPGRAHVAAPGKDAGGGDGIAVWMVLYAVLMVALMTFLGGANLIGDRFSRSPAVAWSEPG